MKNAILFTYAAPNNAPLFFIEANCEITGKGVMRQGNVNPTTILFTVTAAAFRKLSSKFTILTK